MKSLTGSSSVSPWTLSWTAVHSILKTPFHLLPLMGIETPVNGAETSLSQPLILFCLLKTCRIVYSPANKIQIEILVLGMDVDM